MICLLLWLGCLGSPRADAPPADASPPLAPPAAPLAAPPPAVPIDASDPWTLAEAITRAGLRAPLPAVHLSLDKPTRALTLWSGEVALKRYRVGLGDPEGDKVRSGDRRTPEGTLHIVTRNKTSQFHRFLGLDYPTAEDATRGLAAGLITSSQARALQASARAGVAPNWNTALGGAVGIHGGGGSADWTLGCIAVENAEIDELWEVVAVGTVLQVSGTAAFPLP